MYIKLIKVVKQQLLILTVAMLVLCACTPRPRHEDAFICARAVMDSCPECALAILDSIPTVNLQPGLDSARYILLHALAENKAHCLTTSDSTIQLAIDVFRETEQKADLRSACYMKGWIMYLNEEYDKALPALLESESLIDSETPELEKGLIYHALADHCNTTMNGIAAIEYAGKAYAAYVEAHKYYHALFALLDQATYFNNSAQYNEAKKIFTMLSDSATLRKDTTLLSLSYDGLCRSEAGIGNFPIALSYLRKHKELADTLDPKTWGMWLYLEKEAGNAKVADSLARIQLSQDNPWVAYALDPSKTIPETLIGAYELQDANTNREILRAYTDNYTAILSDNFRLRQEAIRYRLRLKHLYNVVLVGLLAITTLGGALGIIYFHKRAKEQYNYALCLSTDIKALLDRHKQTVKELEDKNDQYDRSFSSRMEILDKYTDTLNKLAKSCYRGRPAWSVVGSKLTSLTDNNINNLRNDEKLKKEMENLADFRHANLIKRFKEEIPDAKEEDVSTITMLSVGCTPLVISKVLELSSVNYFGVRRQRLRNMIKIKNPPSLQDFLRFL